MKTRRQKRQKRQKRRTQRGGEHALLKEQLSEVGKWLLELDIVKRKTAEECSRDPGLCLYTKEECKIIMEEYFKFINDTKKATKFIDDFLLAIEDSDKISLNILYERILRIHETITRPSGLNRVSTAFSYLALASSSLAAVVSYVAGDGPVVQGLNCTAIGCQVVSATTKVISNLKKNKNMGKSVLEQTRNVASYSGFIPGCAGLATCSTWIGRAHTAIGYVSPDNSL